MNLEIRSLADRGDHQKERLTLRCVNDTDMGHYALLQTSSRDGVVNTGVKRTIWFPDKLIQTGDLVVVYTRQGTQSEKVLTTGKKAHFLYWGFSVPIWEEDDAGAVLLHAPEWDARLAGSL
jgi:hypothetical protein